MRSSYVALVIIAAITLNGILLPTAAGASVSSAEQVSHDRFVLPNTPRSLVQTPALATSYEPQGRLEYLQIGVDAVTCQQLVNTTDDQMADEDKLTCDDEISEDSRTLLPDMNGTEIDGKIGFVLYGNVSDRGTGIDVSTSLRLQGGGAAVAGYDPNRPPAAPIDVAKEGHWFPNAAYSQIRYEVSLWVGGGSGTNNQFYIHVDRVQDTYGRYFRVFLDGTKILETVIGSSGFDGYVQAYTSNGAHTIVLEIQWGYYSNNGWKLVSFRPSVGAVTGEFFPKTEYARLRWNVYLGPATEADIKIVNVNDPWSRYLAIYVDGSPDIHLYNVPCDSTFQIQFNGEKHTLHEVALELIRGDTSQFEWKLAKFDLGYLGIYYEVDYMVGHVPHSDVLSYVRTYFMTHSYERPVFFIDDQVPEDTIMTWNDYQAYYSAYCDSKWSTPYWKYILFGHYDEDGGALWYLGWCDRATHNQIFIAEQTCHDIGDNFWYWLFYGVSYPQVAKCALMHEVGHSINIIDYKPSGDEDYCTNSFCVMAKANWDNFDDKPYYCGHHYAERQFPI